MFGYITVFKPEMKVKDFALYEGYYCGLCRMINSHSSFGKYLLNYDCTFLYLLLAKDAELPKLKEIRCVSHPVRKKKVFIAEKYADEAACINILLAYHNLLDKKNDGDSVLSGAAAAFLKKSYKKVSKLYPEDDSLIREKLDALSQLENRKSFTIDEICSPFAELLGELIARRFPEKRNIFYEFGYYLGKWIYLMDAFDDRNKDLKKKSFNPFNILYENDEDKKKEAEFLLKSSVNQITLAYDLIEKKNGNIENVLDNIVYLGLKRNTESVLKGEKINSNGSI